MMEALPGRRKSSAGVTIQGSIADSNLPAILDADNIASGFDEESYFKWVKSNFYIPVCHYFIPSPKDKNLCKCGRSSIKHGKITAVYPEETPWSPTEHCQLEPTSCFGTINFVNEDSITMPKFIRVGTTSTVVGAKYTIPEQNIDAIKSLMLDHWKLTTPGLLISVTGGAKSFRLNKTMAIDFQQGLMAAAKATGAWIITGGENCGVMSLVGEAVSLSSFNSSIVALGIANWGKTLNRDMLHTDYAADDIVIDYRTGQNIKGESALDPHHTHLFLVDDGYPNKAGCEIKYRIEIQDIIQDMFVHEGMGLPKVCILLEGGESSIDCALNAVQYKNPLLIVKGTGRAADIVCYALEHAESYEKISGSNIKIFWKLGDNATKALKMLIEKHFHKYGFDVCSRIFIKVLQIIDCYKMCKIYNTQDESGLDYAILLALISSITESGAATRQMQLAIAWRQPRVAKQFIFSKHMFRADQLNHFLDIAIDHESTEFIRLLLYQGADLKDYLTIGELTQLYNSFPDVSSVAKMLYQNEGVQVTLAEVGMMIEVILEGTYKSPLRLLGNQNNDINDTFANPYDLMMTYATLRGNFDMAMLFWEFTKAPTMCALLGFKICHWLIKMERKNIQTDDDHVLEMTEAANRFEEYAIGVMDECSSEYSRTHLQMFLSVPRKEFSNLNVVDMAYTLEAKKFVSHPAYQAHLTDIWMGEIEHTTSTFFLLLGCTGVCIFLDIFNKKRMTTEEVKRRNRDKERTKALSNQITHIAATAMPRVSFSGKNHKDSKRKKRKSDAMMRSLTSWERLRGFYNAPVIKFILTGIFTLAFVVIYSTSVLFIDYSVSMDPVLRNCGSLIGISVQRKKYHACLDYYDTLDPPQTIGSLLSYFDLYILIWIISTIPTELKQIWGETPISICSKLKKYYSSFYNVLDVCAVVLYFFGFYAKATETEWDLDPFQFTIFNMGRLFCVLSLTLYIFRFLQLFEISPKMGPKINMIQKMANDLIFFIFILVIFLVMYMVFSEAIVNPLRSDFADWRETILETFQRSFFNVFGDIDVSTLNEGFKEHHCIQIARFRRLEYDVILENNSINDTWGDFAGYMTHMSGFNSTSGCEAMEITEIFKMQENNAVYAELNYALVFLSLCVYLLLSNVMLINLLIAIFSSTYDKVEEESDVIYRYGRCSVIKEFSDRYILPNPLNLFECSIVTCRWIRNQILIGRKVKERENKNADPEVEYKVGLIEAECRALFKKRQEFELTPETLLMNELKRKTEKVEIEVKEIRDSVKSVLAELHISNKNKITPVTELWKRIFSHKYSRESPYPGTLINKFPVPDNKISWNVKYEAYHPTKYDNPRLKLFDEPADPYLVSYFNDNKQGINRISDVTEYAIVDGRPLNPKGRTGLAGRGELERWGPNHITLSLVSRWAKRDNKLVVINNLRVLELVAIRRTGNDMWDLPNGYVDVGESISGGHKRNFMENVLGLNETSGVDRLKMIQETDRMMQSGIILYKGYFDDSRNTDNAWIEVHAVNYHQEEPPYPSQFEPGDFIEEVTWKVLDDKTSMNRNNLWILKKMCIHLGAYNPYKGEVLI